MKRKVVKSSITYTDEPLGDFEIIPDFLPKPWELAKMTRNKKVTITLNEESIAVFKRQAKKYNVPYQAMIRNLLQQYTVRAKE